MSGNGNGAGSNFGELTNDDVRNLALKCADGGYIKDLRIEEIEAEDDIIFRFVIPALHIPKVDPGELELNVSEMMPFLIGVYAAEEALREALEARPKGV